MNRPRCVVCGGLVEGSGRVCGECEPKLAGFCGRCQARERCGRNFRAAARRLERDGLEPPRYPPCVVPPASSAVVSRALQKRQAHDYGAPVAAVVGVIVLVLAAEDGSGSDALDRASTTITEAARAGVDLANAWGGRWVALERQTFKQGGEECSENS